MVRIIIILILLGLSQIGTAQIQARQIRAKAPFDSLYIMTNEQDSNATNYRLGRWYNAYTLIDSLMGLIGGGGGGSMSSWLLAASGTGGTETITNGETVTFTGAGINVATRSTNNVTITGTEVDGDITNEIQSISVTGTTTATLDLSSDATDASITGAGINVVSVVGNAITITGTEVDGSTTNEAWTIDGDAGDTEVIDTETVLFDGTGIVTTTYTAASNTLVINATEVDGSITNELIDAYEDNSISEADVTIIDLGDGFDWNPSTGGQVDLQYDFSEFPTDAATEGDEFIIMYDPIDGPEKIDVDNLPSGAADGNGIFDAANDGGTVPTDMDILITDQIDFEGGLFYIDDVNNEIGVNTATPDAAFNVESAGNVEGLFEDVTTDSDVQFRLKARRNGVGNVGRVEFYNNDADISTDYGVAYITALKSSATVAGGKLQLSIGYNSSGSSDEVFNIVSRETGATDGIVNVAGGLRYKWTESASSHFQLTTGDFGLVMTLTTVEKIARLPEGTTTTIGQFYQVFNDAPSGNVKIRIAVGSTDVIHGDTVLAPNELVQIQNITSNQWAIMN